MCHVLVIEDEPLIAEYAEYVADVAKAAGATSVVLAASQAEAMTAARRLAPDVILSDVDLKAGGTGPDACCAIRAEFGAIPVIFITGTPERCEACEHAAAILTKPIMEGRVIEAFRQVASH